MIPAENRPDLESADQRAIADVIRTAAAEVYAPDSLRMRIEELRAERGPQRRRRKLTLAGGFAAAAAAVAIAVVAILPSETPGSPTIVQAASLATRASMGPAPAPTAAEPKLLAASQDGVPFPNYVAKFGWKSAGTRTDTVDGHAARTVFYEKNGKRIGYTILGGSFVDHPGDARSSIREKTKLWSYDAGGRLAVTWKRRDHTCILSGDRDVAQSELLNLAGWRGKGAVPV